MLDILTDPLIRVATRQGNVEAMSLSQIFASLLDDIVDTFPALRPHQRHAWHSFLVQLGAVAVQRAGIDALPTQAEEWTALLHGLTPDYPDCEPWQLVVDDITKPAFMQPPTRSVAKEADYNKPVETPDELDILVTAKSYDLKAAVALEAKVDDWIFALISQQTMGGFDGAGNYGISRMNGGLGSRSAVSLAPSARIGLHVKRDMEALQEIRPNLLADFPTTDQGVALVWILPWDGTSAERLALHKLAPCYIEVCRRVRLRQGANGLHAIRAASRAPRIEAKEFKGQVGDPWAPVNTKESKCLTLASGGFTYRRIVHYLTSQDWRRPPLLEATRAERETPSPMQLVARGMVRGQGKTEGWHERIIPFREKILMAMHSPRETQELEEICQERIEQIAAVQRILRHAIAVFAAGGDSTRVQDEHRARANPWVNKLDEFEDARFFSTLQTEYEAESDQRGRIRDDWLMNQRDGVVDRARRILLNAADSLPCPSVHRYRAWVRAEGIFESRIRGSKGLPALFDKTNQENDR